MSSNKDSSSDFLTTKTSGPTTQGTTSRDHNDASQTSLLASNSSSQKGTSYILEAWANAPSSSDPWSPAKAAYFPQR
ncbi:hypothetical protein N7536_012046 [Penicillium majusculum]|uniref:Uncharacterized protein n=1 Tax=Penicillium solitum TaxID=60172 RepID=A0A1V6R601_9EURO|nr:uncharacterized protein PENSOL_c014G09086 [Penicillium solitum]KAJ5680907.1 hypothetical protein N7536_012046 [Penicillium majusculum]OQD96945.1 hypothetical protein PENSOL_c014G09086 [Penicillium solitum]